MLSLGMPMISMGDEVRRTQRGNNNAYCQDNEISWFDWTLLEKHADVHRFVSLLNARRLLRDVEHERQRAEPEPAAPGSARKPGMASSSANRTGAHSSHSLAFSAEASARSKLLVHRS